MGGHHWSSMDDWDREDESQEPCEFNGVVSFITPEAFLIDVDGSKVWIPDSLMEYDNEPIIGEELDFSIPFWVAESKGLL
jgi:hypothetical protein